MTKIKLYVANPQSCDSGAAKGTSSNPYTEAEYESMINNGTWPGGYVQNMGYVMKEVVISSSYPDSGVVDSDDSWTWSEPWDISSEPWDGTDGCGNSGNNHNGGSQGGGAGNPYPQHVRTFSGTGGGWKVVENVGLRSIFRYECHVKITGYIMSISVSVDKMSFKDRDFSATAIVKCNSGIRYYPLSPNKQGYICHPSMTVVGDVSFELPKTGNVIVEVHIGYIYNSGIGYSSDSKTICIYPY